MSSGHRRVRRNRARTAHEVALAFSSTVDNSFMAGSGRRKDGWPNRDLNVGAIIALSPVLAADKKAVYQSWGPGKYDPRYNQDGKSAPLVLPPAYGLAQVKNETYTAEGVVNHYPAAQP